ncbi:DMT family transporter [Saccharicrinis sp. FJH62]|uniref:DMT family transporter n=1 Tax=Saccharicrinis sp. FJH62 TaxID=3344657 RepID=UPI0035D3E900
MFQTHFGEVASVLTALFWTVTALAFEAAGKRVGALSLNLIRLFMGFIYLSIYSLISRDLLLPVDATSYQWFWLFLSGIIGFVLGDLMLFQAFILIGARISMLIMSLVPLITAIIAWITLGEVLTVKDFLAMGLTITGIVIVMLVRKRVNQKESNKTLKKERFSKTMLGLLFAFGGALGQATGLVLSKKGMGSYDAFAATQIRIIAGIAGFIIVVTVMRRWKNVRAGLLNIPAVKRMALGSFTGPFLGVAFSLLAVQNTNAGIAATIMAIVPVLIIPPAILINKEKVHIAEIAGAIISVGGVALFFM